MGVLVPLILKIVQRSFVPANWAFGFPLAALATGLATYGVRLEQVVLIWLGMVVLLVVSGFMVWALIGTARLLVKS